jgi:peptide deformylase
VEIGTTRDVRRAPDRVLATPALEADPADALIVALCDDLVATMRAAPGCVGVAAPQIGAGVRAFALDVTGHRKARSCHGLVVLVNPRLVDSSGSHLAREGCLSVPDLTGDVARPESVVVAGVAPVTGESLTYEADAFEARAFCHELDHLDGRLFLDRVGGAHAIFARKRYQ